MSGLRLDFRRSSHYDRGGSFMFEEATDEPCGLASEQEGYEAAGSIVARAGPAGWGDGVAGSDDGRRRAAPAAAADPAGEAVSSAEGTVQGLAAVPWRHGPEGLFPELLLQPDQAGRHPE